MAKMYVHINRFELKKLEQGKGGRPWTIHTSKGCIPAAGLSITAKATAECFPKRRANPKCFIVVNGKLKKVGKDRYEIVPEHEDRRARVAGGSLLVDIAGLKWYRPR